MRFLRIALSLFIVVSSAHAHNKVVVVPLLEDRSAIANVVTVAKEGGDYTDIAQALESITNASETNRYLVQIGPGIYNTTKSLHVKWGVSVVGSGIETTRIVGRSNPNSYIHSVFIAEQDTHFSNFTVEATGVGEPHIMGFRAIEGTQTAGQINPATVTSVRILVSGSLNNFGIHSSLPDFNIKNSEIVVRAYSSTSSYAIYQGSGLPHSIRVEDSEIEVLNCNGSNCVGVYIDHESWLFITNSLLRMGSRDLFALDIRFGANAIIRNSALLGSISLDRSLGANFTFPDSILKIMNSTVYIVEGEGAFCLNSNNEVVELLADCGVSPTP